MSPSIAAIEAALATPRAPRWNVEGRVPSAVCVPLIARAGELEVWIIRRPDGMRHHARELAFPGGKADRDDASLVDTALREMHEELGIARASARVLGALTPVPPATSRFLIHPFVAEIDATAAPVPAPAEVAELIRAPIRGFFDGTIAYGEVDMGIFVSPIFAFGERRMYGASAHILLELLEVCAAIIGVRLPVPKKLDAIPWA